MRLSLVFSALAATVPAFANAIPRVGKAIPLTKHTTQVADDQGVVNREMLKSLGAKTSRKLNRGFLAYEKNMGRTHPFAMKQSAGGLRGREAGSGSAPLTDADVLYYGPISVGTPPVNYTVMFDTGSSDLFLPGTTCGASCHGRKIYNTSASSTAQGLDEPFKLSFLDKSTVEGEVFSDTVTLAGLTVTNQSVGAASEYSPNFLSYKYPPDGLIGMALYQVSVFGKTPFFENLVAQGSAKVPQFSFKLTANSSELFLGGADTSLFTGNFTNLNLTVEGFWQVSVDSVNAYGKSAISGVQAIIDNGSPFIAGPKQDVFDYYKAIPGSKNASSTVGPGLFTFPCNSDPQVSLTFGGKQFAVSGFNVGKAAPGSSDCVGGIMAISGIDFWVIGDVFLSGYYTKFDTNAMQVGFADLA